jgi:hypothetical protein
MKKDGTSSKGNNIQCKACRAFKYTAEKRRTPKHLMALYQKSLEKDKKAQDLDMKLTSPSHLKLVVRARIPRIQAPTSRP